MLYLFFCVILQFMRDELEVNDEERHSHFHGNDDFTCISVEELWQSWVQSEG